MDLIELKNLLIEKQYPQGFIDDVILFYPMMIEHYGEIEVDNFLREWKYVFFDKLGASGNIEREKNQINVNLYFAEELWDERLITALFHELGHALGTLDIPVDDLLSQGHDRENFFVKMDEAVVSDFQYDIMHGQLQYGYFNKQYNFKCRGGVNDWHKYPIEKLFYNILKIILGDKRNLIIELMHEKDTDKKIQIYRSIIDELKTILNEQEIETLLDSCAVMILNHGYGESDTQTMASPKINGYLQEVHNYNLSRPMNEDERKQFDIEFNQYVNDFYNKHWKKIVEYGKERQIIGTDIFTQIDKLCLMVVNHLIGRIQSTDDIDFSTIRAISEYLVKINNRSVDKEKNDFLINTLLEYLDKLNIGFDDEIEQMFSRRELLGVIAKIITLNDFNIDMLNAMSIIKKKDDGTIYLKCGDTIIKLSKPRENDQTYDDCLGSIDVNTVLPQMKLNLYNRTIGDANIDNTLVDESRFFCKVDLEQIKNK